MIIRTEAIVLRSIKYKETSLIVTLFTSEKGKISVLAKGARQLKSRFGATLQPMSYIQALVYYKPTRSLQTLTESAYIRPMLQIGQDLAKITVGMRMVELVAALMQEEQQNLQVFRLVQNVLACLDSTEGHPENVLAYFQLHLGATLGFAPDIDRSLVQSLPDDGGLLALDQGAILPPQVAQPNSRKASRTALRAFAIFARADLDTVMRMQLTLRERHEVNNLIEAYLRFHVEDLYPVRSEKVFDQMISPS